MTLIIIHGNVDPKQYAPYVAHIKKSGRKVEIVTIPNDFRDFKLNNDPQYVANSNSPWASLDAADRHIAKALKTMPYFLKKFGDADAIDNAMIDGWTSADVTVFIERSAPDTNRTVNDVKDGDPWMPFRSYYRGLASEILVQPDGSIMGPWEILEELQGIAGYIVDIENGRAQLVR